jgi:tetratricopeptide (TPR) repeat protein
MNLASLYLGLNKNKQALDIFKEWHDIQKKPSAEALIFGGSLYAENEEYIQAISLINRAINLSRTPKDSWLRRAAAIYIKMGDYTKASKVLSTLVSNNPENVSQWKQLAASYYYSGNEEKALSVMLLAFEKSLFKTEKEILDLARLAASQNIPLTASEVLERGINDGIVPRNRESLILLGNIYIQAREYDRGIESLTAAADISNDSKLYLRVANLYSDLQQWDSVLKVLGEHLPDEPQLKSRGLLLKGIALYENGRVDESRKTFRQASSHKESGELASTWLEYIN